MNNIVLADKEAKVNGVKLHYLVAGKGSPVVLLHGYAETSHMWLPLIDKLTKHHTVIAPDLRGAGNSEKPLVGDLSKAYRSTPREALERSRFSRFIDRCNNG